MPIQCNVVEALTTESGQHIIMAGGDCEKNNRSEKSFLFIRSFRMRLVFHIFLSFVFSNDGENTFRTKKKKGKKK